MPEPPARLHVLSGLDDRDLALLATACTNQANFLAHLAAGSYDASVVHRAGYQHDQHQASTDADRLHEIARALHRRRQQHQLLRDSQASQ
jgi:hypothetical protein